LSTDLQVQSYQWDVAAVTDRPVTPQSPTRGLKRLRGKRDGNATSPALRADAEEVLAALQSGVDLLLPALRRLGSLRRPGLLGKVEEAERLVSTAGARLAQARERLQSGDLGGCGQAVKEANRPLSEMGGPLILAINGELASSSFSRQAKADLQANVDDRRTAQQAVEQVRRSSLRSSLLASEDLYRVMARGVEMAADVLSRQADPTPTSANLRSKRRGSTDGDEVPILAPQELETFADVGGLDDAKEQLRRTVGTRLERGADAPRPGLLHNGVLLYGPPGTGKTLLARAVAGEYGLRFLRFSPAVIASAYQHEPAKKLRQLFATAADNAPSLLFLDEVDAIAGRRDGMVSPDQRELATQLLNSLEEYRAVPGLVIMAATNTLDHLDPALREGRFDTRIAVPLPDIDGRAAILEVQLERFGDDVDWDALDIGDLARRTSGRSGAAIGAIVTGAAERAMAAGGPIGQAELLTEIAGRSGQDRQQTLEHQVSWDDVVLPDAVRDRIHEILVVFQQPELGRQLGVLPPAGILLYGPPGTGKTTIARALATEAKASFYEQSAADLLSKWVGESEQKVAQLFSRARANRPSIIFCDEIDAVLKRRSADSSAPWEERVVSQFLRELDGLHSGEGVLLVGATNRPDIIDDAVRDRRMVAIEVPLPDGAGRLRLLEVLCRGVRTADDVDVGELAAATEGMSGSDLKGIRNGAGMKALARVARADEGREVAVARADFVAALADRGITLTPPAPRKEAAPAKKAVAKKRTAAKGMKPSR